MIKYDFSQLPEIGDKQASALRLRHCGKLQFLKHAIAAKFGGHDDSFEALVCAHRALGKHCLDSGLILSINAHLWGSIFPIITYGTARQQNKWLPELLAGEIIGGHAITEPQAGSDINALSTTATVTGQGFILKGHKRYITNTPIADVLIIYARLEDKLTAFLVNSNDDGVIFSDAPTVTGCASATMGDVILDDCFIPTNRQLGKAGAGAMMIQNALELERAFIFSGISGIMDWQLQTIVKFSRERKTKSGHLGQNQAISHKIAEMKVRLDTLNLWLNECARLKSAKKRLSLASAETKLYGSESFLQSSLDAAHILGASGLETNQIMGQFVQDALASRLFSGSSEIQKNMIAALQGVGDGYRN